MGSFIMNKLLIHSKDTEDETLIKKRSSGGNLAPKLSYKKLATLEYPDGCVVNNQKFDRWSSCMNPEQDKLYMLFSNQKFSWIYSFSFNDDNSFA